MPHAKILRTASCKWCGVEFSKMCANAQRMNSCSDECTRALIGRAGAWARVVKPKAVKAATVKTCGWCKQAFNARGAGHKYCSSQCASKGGYESGKGKRLAILRERYVPKSPRPMACLTCGEAFNTKGHATYCLPCGIIKAKAMKRDYEKRRDAQKRGVDGVKTEYIKVAYIYKRDAWRCGICHKRVNKTLAYPHLMSASLDHIVPLAHGGTHTKANVQLAHFICNSTKSDRLDVQTLLFG